MLLERLECLSVMFTGISVMCALLVMCLHVTIKVS